GRMETKKLLVADSGLPAGTILEYTDQAIHNVGTTSEYGYLSIQTNADGTYKTFTEYFSADQPKYVKEYTAAGVLQVTYEYDATGKLVKKTDLEAEYTYYIDANNRMATKTLLVAQGSDAAGTVYQYYNENFYGTSTPTDTSDDYGRIYMKILPDSTTSFTYLAYYQGTDLKAQVTETGAYAGTTNYFYHNYSINYKDDPANEIGFRKVDAAGDTYEFEIISGEYHLRKTIDASESNRTFWYYWDEYPELGGIVVEAPTSWSGENWVLYQFDNTSDPLNPTVDWNSATLITEPTDKPELGNYPPSPVEYPTGGVPAADLYVVESEQNVVDNSTPYINVGHLYDMLDSLQGVSTGVGVTIAILDTGIDETKLDINVTDGYDFAGSNIFDYTSDEDYTDVSGHGTETASIIVGPDGDGVAPQSDIMALKVFDDFGNTSSEVVANAIKYAVDNGARIIVMPFSLFPTSEPVNKAIDYAVSKDVILIAAAGNSSTEILDASLAANDNVITVGSANSDGTMSAWSNYGSELDLLAPWDVVTVTTGDEKEAGTSFSAAFVAGVAALVLEENPDLSSEEVLAVLKNMMGVKTNETGLYENIGTFMIEGYGKVGDTKVSKEGDTQEVKGASTDEVLSLQAVKRQNLKEFTGSSIKMELYKKPE
ncbi:MAG: S8/S53 family peptidase, partial [Candidatus Omnitrophica bacterium]|nr:S8/S53 family peptidase [Candidatus Omnitrophota bacterium]